MPQTSAIDNAGLFAPPPQQASRGDLGQEDFLTLMITQFRNQDPFEPMDNGAFLGQLAQFSTVSGIESLNSSFAGLSGALQNEQALQAANLIGHSVLANTDIAYLGDQGELRGGLELQSSAGSVQVDITDRSGQLIRRIDLGEQQAGVVRFAWDGLDASGERADADHYKVSVRVIRGENVESAQTLIEAGIESVTLGQNGRGMSLNLVGGDSLSLSQVFQII